MMLSKSRAVLETSYWTTVAGLCIYEFSSFFIHI
jgi:hypothetical protein